MLRFCALVLLLSLEIRYLLKECVSYFIFYGAQNSVCLFFGQYVNKSVKVADKLTLSYSYKKIGNVDGMILYIKKFKPFP